MLELIEDLRDIYSERDESSPGSLQFDPRLVQSHLKTCALSHVLLATRHMTYDLVSQNIPDSI